MDIVLSNLSPLLAGLWITLSIAVLSFVGAMILGTVVAVMRISPIAPLRAVGQFEPARSIGLTFGQSMRFVILPQALRSMVQPLVNVWIGTLIGSSLASVIGIQDATAVGQSLNNRYAGGLAVFASIAAIYVVIALLSGGVGGWIERRVAVQR